MKPNSKFNFNPQYYPIFAVLWLFSAVLLAQPRDTVAIYANDTTIFQSKYFHWTNAQYTWTLSGSGYITLPTSTVPIVADARFSLTDISGVQKPKLPIDDNSSTILQILCQTSKPTCSSYLATNAVFGTKKLTPIVKSNALGMKYYRFIPDIDVYNSAGIYESTVNGSDNKAQFMYIDRYGEQNNIFYNDNLTSGKPTTLSAAIQRKSPEIIVLQTLSPKILNDNIPTQVFREETLNFGQVSISGGGIIEFDRILRNRGISNLQIQSIELNPTVSADFTVLRGDIQPLTTPISLQRETTTDSLLLKFIFSPKSVGNKQIEVLVYCNDLTQTASAGRNYFRFILQGIGTGAEIKTDTIIDFGSVRVGKPDLTKTLIIQSVGNVPANIQKFDGLQSPFSVTSAISPFGNVQPILNLSKNSFDSVRLVFSPTKFGDFTDTLLLFGDNIGIFRVILRGSGLQSAAKIYNDKNKPDADTIDFGSTLMGIPVIQKVTILNAGNVTLLLNGQVAPNFSLTDSPNSSINSANDPQNADHLEFDFDTWGKVEIDSTFKFFLTFKASNSIPAGRKEAYMDIALTERDITADTVIKKRFVLIGHVTEIASGPTEIDFGLIYVNPVVPPAKTWDLTNNTDTTVGLNNQTLIPFNGTTDFSNTNLKDTVAGRDLTTNQFKYNPKDRGLDSALFSLDYVYPRLSGGAVNGSVKVKLRGMGVEQNLAIQSAFNTSPPFSPCSIRHSNFGDTIDVGNILTCQNLQYGIEFVNHGNITFSLQAPFQIFEPNDNDFSFDKLLLSATKSLAVDNKDTILFTFKPQKSGTQIIKYTLSSDIKSRVETAPDSVRNIVFFIKATGINPQIDRSLLSDTLDFGSVAIVKNCKKQTTKSIKVHNIGNTILNVAPTISSPDGLFLLVTNGNFSVAPDLIGTVTVSFTPLDTGLFVAKIALINNQNCADTMRIFVKGRGILPPLVNVSLPAIIRAKPGTLIAVPVYVDSNVVSLSSATAAKFTLTFEKSLMDFVSEVHFGTAAENKQVIATKSDGKIDVEFSGSSVFSQKSPIILLYFNTFLGEKQFTEITISDFEFSDQDCQGILSLKPKGGIFALDSVCGISQKTLGTTVGLIRLDGITPNPLEADGSIEFEIPFETRVTLTIYNSQGILAATLVDEIRKPGVYSEKIPLDKLATGMYFCEMKADIYRKIKQFSVVK